MCGRFSLEFSIKIPLGIQFTGASLSTIFGTRKKSYYVKFVLNSDRKWIGQDKRPFYGLFWSFFANHMIICHKTEVQTVVLRCLTSLNLNLFKRCYIKCKYFHFWTRLTHEKISTDKWPFYDHFWPYFWQLCFHLSQNWGSDGHFEVLNESKS